MASTPHTRGGSAHVLHGRGSGHGGRKHKRKSKRK